MNTLREIAEILRENGEDQLEVQMEIMSVNEDMLNAINSLIETFANLPSLMTPDISLSDMVQNELVEGAADALTTSEEEAQLQSQSNILGEIKEVLSDILIAVTPDPVQDLEGLEGERESGGAPRVGGGGRGLGLGKAFEGIKKVIGKVLGFFKTIGLVIGAAILGIMAFGDDETVNNMLDSLKSVFTTITEALTPTFNFIKDELLPKLIDMIPPVLEALGLLFEKVIAPILNNFVLPVASMAMDLLKGFFEFLVDALKNPREVAEEVMFDIVDFFKDIGDFFGNMVDKVMIALGNTVNNIVEGLAEYVQDFPVVGEKAAATLREMKVDFGTEAEERMNARAEESAARDARSRELNAETAVRRSGAEGEEAELIRLKSIQQQMAMEGLTLTPEFDEVTRQIIELESPPTPATTQGPTAVASPTATVGVTPTPSVAVQTAPTPAVSIPVPATPPTPAGESVPKAITIPEGVRVTPSGLYASYNKFTNSQAQFETVEEAVKFKDATIEQAATMDSYAAKIYEERKQLDEQMRANFTELEGELATQGSAGSVVPVVSREDQSSQMTRATQENADMKAESAGQTTVVAPNTSNVSNISTTTNNIMQEMPASKDTGDSYGGIVGVR